MVTLTIGAVARIPAANKALQGKVVRLRGTAREHDLARTCVKQRGYLPTGILHPPASCLPCRVSARRIPDVPQHRKHGAEDALIKRRGGVVVEVDVPQVRPTS